MLQEITNYASDKGFIRMHLVFVIQDFMVSIVPLDSVLREKLGSIILLTIIKHMLILQNVPTW